MAGLILFFCMVLGSDIGWTFRDRVARQARVLWHPSREAFVGIHERCMEFTRNQLSLEFKPGHIRRSSVGVPFLECQIWPTRRELSGRSKRRWRRRIHLLERAERLGLLSEADLQQRLSSLTAFAMAAAPKELGPGGPLPSRSVRATIPAAPNRPDIAAENNRPIRPPGCMATAIWPPGTSRQVVAVRPRGR